MQPSQLWIVWFSMLVALGVYGAMPLVLPAEPVVAAPEPLFVTALSIVGVATGVASLVMRQLLLVRPARAGTLDPSSPAGMQRVSTGLLMCWVFSESIGIYGLVLFFLYRVPGLLYPFIGAAVALMLVHAPRRLPTPAASSRDLARPDVKIG